jgi:hypothetical protein
MLVTKSRSDAKTTKRPITKAQRPLTQDEWDTHVASQAARPPCAECGQPLLLIQPGRKRCEACRMIGTPS